VALDPRGSQGRGVEAVPVVGDIQGRSAVQCRQAQCEAAGMSVAHRVAHRLLRDAEHRLLLLLGHAVGLAVVDVDVETGLARLRRLVAVDDAGTIINPLLAEGQVHGGIAQGASQVLQEEIVYDGDGQPRTTNFADYAIVSAADLPSFELVPMETPTFANALGAKGVGESGTIGSIPAVYNAVVDALAHLGVRHLVTPATPERVWRAVQEASGVSSGEAPSPGA